MGWFSDEIVFTVGVSRSPMIREFPNPLATAVMNSILAGNSVTRNLLFSQMYGFSSNMEKYYKYGKNHYLRGLPKGSGLTIRMNPEDIADAVASEIGEPATTVGSVYSSIRYLYYVYTYLQDTYGWTLFTNEIILDYGQIYEFDSYTVNGEIYSERNIELKFTVKVPLLPNDLHPAETFRTIGFPSALEYVHATYTIDSQNPSYVYYWMYDPLTEQYPAIDDLINSGTEFPMEFYPIVPIRINGVWMDKNKESEQYLSSNKLLKRIGLGMGDIIDTFKDKDNPTDVEKVDEIYFLLGLNIFSERVDTQRYFYNFFDEMYSRHNVGKLQFENDIYQYDTTVQNEYAAADAEDRERNQVGELPLGSVFRIADVSKPFSEQFRQSINWAYITKEVKVGQLEFRWEMEFNDIENFVIPIDIRFHFYKPEYPPGAIFFKKDNRDGTYTEIGIYAPSSRVRVQALDEEEFAYGYLTNSKPDQSGFYIPLVRDILRDLPGVREELVGYDAMMLAIYSADKQVIPWYQTEDFLFLLEAVVSVAGLFFGGPAIGKVLSAAISIGIREVIKQVAILLVKYLIMKYVVKWLLANVNPELALVITAVIAVALGRLGASGGLSVGLPIATDFIRAVLAVASAIQVDAQTTLAGLKEEYDEFSEEYEKRSQAIDDAQDLLLSDSILDPSIFLQKPYKAHSPNESPEAFYNRTIHTKNPGVLSLDVIEVFVEGAVRLPLANEPTNFRF